MSRPVSIAPDVLRRLKGLPKAERAECLLALCELVDGFGRFHVHSGLGIRKLGGRVFECRGSRALRFVFLDRPDDLFVAFLGSHDEVQAALRRGRYR